MDLTEFFYTEEDTNSIPINVVLKSEFSTWKKVQSDALQNWIETAQFKPKRSALLCVPDAQGTMDSVVVVADEQDLTWTLGSCVKQLPPGHYHISSNQNYDEKIYLGWILGAYQFSQYKKSKSRSCKLFVDSSINIHLIEAQARAITTVRNMVNTPAADMMPQHISNECKTIAEEFNQSITEVVGDDLLNQNYPVIHAVGRASVHAPRLIEFNWGDSKHPKVCLIGKGVSFDSGGLDIKSSQGMRLMKKDMGGAAHVVGLAYAIMKLNIPIQLHVLVPAVENAISGDAFRPGDVLPSRNGKTIEIDNTDAEGRLILCDAITKAVEGKPDLIIDFATLTGAARIALGTEVPAFFSNDDLLANELTKASESTQDSIWYLPLHKPYRYMLDSNIADICNSAASGYGGAITAALFLSEFVPVDIKWVHFDVMAWNTRAREGRPKGGEAMGLRAVLEFLQQHYS